MVMNKYLLLINSNMMQSRKLHVEIFRERFVKFFLKHEISRHKGISKLTDNLENFIAKLERLSFPKQLGGIGSPSSIDEFLMSLSNIKCWKERKGIYYRDKRIEKKIKFWLNTCPYKIEREKFKDHNFGHFRIGYEFVILKPFELKIINDFITNE